MGDLRKSLPLSCPEATLSGTLLIILRMKFGGHFLKKFLTKCVPCDGEAPCKICLQGLCIDARLFVRVIGIAA